MLRGLPPVHRFLSDPLLAPYEAAVGKSELKRGVIEALDGVRLAGGAGVPSYEHLRAQVVARVERDASRALARVVNATGIVLHTNLGRAPLASAALDAMRPLASGYTNLEFDLDAGERGSRYARATGLLRAVTSADDALVVNNCAAAVLLLLDTFAKEREVVVARNQLIEIGGGFRLPDVLARSGATLVEIGAVNKVYLHDFERALTPRTALVLRAHASNFRIAGFTHDVAPRDLAALGRRAGVPVVEDLGSGALIGLERFGLPHERTVQDALADGIDLVAFSGDKLLGGPQAGIIVGSAALISRMRANPLLRALRIDKIALALLSETLRLYDAGRYRDIPLYAMLGATLDELRSRADRYVRANAKLRAVDATAYVGGGALPQGEVASVALEIRSDAGAGAIASALRRWTTPIVARVERDRVLLDMRTIDPHEDEIVQSALHAIP